MNEEQKVLVSKRLAIFVSEFIDLFHKLENLEGKSFDERYEIFDNFCSWCIKIIDLEY